MSIDQEAETTSLRFEGLFASLAAPFHPDELKSRVGSNGREFVYVTARSVMNRLDDVVGPADWWDEYVMGQQGVLCKLTIRLPDGTEISKWDLGSFGDAGQGDDEKAGVSDAFKRAAVKFGIARYLYRDGVAQLVFRHCPEMEQAITDMFNRVQQGRGGQQRNGGGRQAPQRGQQQQRSQRPQQSERRQDDRGEQRQQQGGRRQDDRGGQQRSDGYGPPRTGKALFAWVKSQEARNGEGLLKYVNGWGKLQEFPEMMVDWDEAETRDAYEEALRWQEQGVESPAHDHQAGDHPDDYDTAGY